MVRRSREIISPAWLYGHKRKIFYYAFSCLGYGPYIRSTNVANSNLHQCLYCDIDDLVQRRTEVRLQEERARQSLSSLVVSSTVQAPPKHAIKIDVLLTDSDNRGS